MGEIRGLSALEAWTRKLTAGYKDVKVTNLTTSWKNGLAFCALIHHFRPDLIDFSSLSKENIHYNNNLAFTIAEKELGIPSLLDADDMVRHIEPDRRSVATYLALFYEKFEGTKSAHNYSDATIDDHYSSLTKSEQNSSPLTTPRASPRRKHICGVCDKPVNITERIVWEGKTYHKRCYSPLECSRKEDEFMVTGRSNSNDVVIASDGICIANCDEINDEQEIGDDSGCPSSVTICSDNSEKNYLSTSSIRFKLSNLELNEINKDNIVTEIGNKLSSNQIEANLKTDIDQEVGSFKTADVNFQHLKSTVKASEIDNESEVYPKDLNPFGDSDEDEDVNKNNRGQYSSSLDGDKYPDELNPFELEVEEFSNNNNTLDVYDNSLNPFGSDDDDEVDDEDDNDENENEKQIEIISSRTETPVPAPRKSVQSMSVLSYSTSSLNESKVKTNIKSNECNTPNLLNSYSNPSIKSFSNSLQRRSRKKGLAPQPPDFSSYNSLVSANADNAISVNSEHLSASSRKMSVQSNEKFEASLKTLSPDILNTPNTFKYWRKRKKRQAPAIPVPRRSMATSLSDIQEECNQIGNKLSLAEEKCKRLESIIESETINKSKLRKYVIELLQLAKEKCILAKRQEELSYMKCQHKLEEQQADIECQIRILDAKPVSIRTKEDEEKSSQLLENYVDIIEKRNDIEEDIINIDKGPDYERMVDRLKKLRHDGSIEIIISDYMKKCSEGKVKSKNKKIPHEGILNKLSTIKMINKKC